MMPEKAERKEVIHLCTSNLFAEKSHSFFSNIALMDKKVEEKRCDSICTDFFF